jgi:sulfite reductase alpha subunit-like flavoprotein/cytochrome b involved in lipid metabolism
LSDDTTLPTAAPRERHTSPAGLALSAAERFNSTVGHENRGFLSWSHGFIPKVAPLTSLGPGFQAWDQLASELPALYRDLSLRRRVEQLPILDASEQNLENRELLRGCALLAIVAHAYWYVEPRAVDALPPSIELPWQQLRARLDRGQEVLTYTDLIVYNWKVRGPAPSGPLRVENLALLLPTIGNREESVFYLTQVEILSQASSMVRAFVDAHDAVLRDDEGGVERALVEIIDCLDRVVSESLLKINPNPYSRTFVDPVVWAKTVAPFAVPLHAGDQGPSGTSSPIFSALDIFFQRPQNSSFLGREIQQLREQYPVFWRQFLDALSAVSVVDFVEATQKPNLQGALREALALYAGEHGFLGRHRMKVYGYLELAFKVGRAVTIGGFSGAFKDRTWDQVDGELEAARVERSARRKAAYQRAEVEAVIPPPVQGSSGIRRVVLDISNSGAPYRIGSRCAVLPENRSALVERTLRALHAKGSELVPLTLEWQEAMRQRLGQVGGEALPMRDLLRFGAIRPVPPRVAEALHARTQDPRLFSQIREGTTQRWELWELLALLAQAGLSTRLLWQDDAGAVDDRLSRLIPPERPRLYSISSVELDAPNRSLRTIELTVGQLRYSAEPARLTMPPPGAGEAGGASPIWSGGGLVKEGTASSFLIHALEDKRAVPFRIERPARFQPPLDESRPIVLFAAGTGVAPYRAFIQARAKASSPGQCWLFLSLRSPDEFLLGSELKAPAEAGVLRLDVAFTRVGGDLRLDPERGFVAVPGPQRRIEELLEREGVGRELFQLVRSQEEGGAGASIYVCGRSGFASTVVEALNLVFQRVIEAERPSGYKCAAEVLRRLSGENRLVFELHTDARPIADESRWISVSEVAQRNNSKAGYWLIIDQVVYDLTEFAELHPGGRRIVQAYAGIDAEHGYARAHTHQPDVDAMREMYRIGRIRPLSFEAFAAVVAGPNGAARISCRAAYQAWVRALHMVVEMQNAHRADLALQDSVTSPVEPQHVAGPYKQSRAAETHQRFLRNYLKPLRGETLPALWSITRGVFAPDQGESWMHERLRHISRDQRSKYVKAISAELAEDVRRWQERQEQLFGALAAARDEDTRLLEELKNTLVHGVQVFEMFETETRQQGAEALVASCRRAVIAIQEYYERLDARWRHIFEVSPLRRGRTSSQWPAASIRRLHGSEFWVLEEFPEQQVAVLRRTPLPPSALAALASDNDALLATLRHDHQNFGLVVDIREAPLRNDSAFERTMAKLRVELTARFKRCAVLLDSPLGELQVTRLERDEGRNTLVTRSVSAAFRFAAGGR